MYLFFNLNYFILFYSVFLPFFPSFFFIFFSPFSSELCGKQGLGALAWHQV